MVPLQYTEVAHKAVEICLVTVDTDDPAAGAGVPFLAGRRPSTHRIPPYCQWTSRLDFSREWTVQPLDYNMNPSTSPPVHHQPINCIVLLGPHIHLAISLSTQPEHNSHGTELGTTSLQVYTSNKSLGRQRYMLYLYWQRPRGFPSAKRPTLWSGHPARQVLHFNTILPAKCCTGTYLVGY